MKAPEEIEKINAERKRALKLLEDAAEIFRATGCSLGMAHVDECIAQLCQDGCDEY